MTMTLATDARTTQRPDWLAAEMPPGYRNRLEELQRLSRELDELGRFGRLLYTAGDELGDAVRETFVALGFEPLATTRPTGTSIVVRLDSARRLLLHVSASQEIIQRRGEDLAHVFHMIHELAGDGDRVVLVANNSPGTRPADRREGVDADAVDLLTRLSVNYLPAPTLFALWTRSVQDRDLGHEFIERLHAQDGGPFVLPALMGA